MGNYKKWVGFIFVILCVFTLTSSRNTVYANTKCTVKEAQSRYKVEVKTNTSSKMIVISAKMGKFDVTLNGQNYKLVAGTPLNIPYATDKTAVLSGKAVLTEGDATCDVDDKNSVVFNINVEVGQANETFPNEFYNNKCADFRNKAQEGGAEKVSFMRQTLSYCYQASVGANYSSKNLDAMMKNAETAWTIKQNALNAPTGDLTPTVGFEKVTDTNLTKNDLKCDPWSKQDNVKKYTYTKNVVNNDVCTTTCKEDLTVIYGPPVSVKAGLCFTYTVTVKSKVTCNAKITGEPPRMPEVCNPYPICNNIAGYTDQAGPNEEFDKCVNKCDGGKYTQSCINKCYNKVYKNSSRTVLSYEDKLNATRVSAKDNANANYRDIYYDIQANGNGKYYWSGNTINWKNGSSYWDQLGKYYFNSEWKAGHTVENLQGRDWGGYSASVSGGYVIRSNGFKAGRNCGESCSWTGCSNDSNTKLNVSDAVDEYNRKLEDYNNKVKQCTSASKCEEKTSTFTMSVLPSTDGSKWTEYKATNRPDKDNTGDPKGDSIINSQEGTCYGKKNTDGDDYKTVINFPGVWINNKTGEVTTIKPPRDEEIFYKAKPNQYCTPLDAKNVNSKWWVWDQKLKDYSDSEKANITKDLKYNIKASIGNFGRFGWDINIKCFYGIYNGPTDECPNGKCPDETCNDPKKCKDTTTIDNYKYKAAVLSDLFTGSKENNNVSETGRETGFNWSCAATDLSNKNYPVAPTATITDIQTKGDSIYSDANELDYSIVLDTKALKKVKSYNKEKANFLDFYGNKYKREIGDEEIMSIYRSQLLDELGKDIVKVRYITGIGCNNQIGGTCVKANGIKNDACTISWKSLNGR